MKKVNVRKGEKVALFKNIAIETSALCNRHCHFCPNDYFKRPDQLMDHLLFQNIIHQLQYLDYRGRVELYIYNEPTRDKRLMDFILLTRTKLPYACIMIATNGDYLKGPGDIVKYFDMGLNQMLINIYSANDGSLSQKSFDNGVKKAEERYQLISGWMKETKIPDNLPLYSHIGASRRTLHISNKFGIRPDTKASDTDFESISNRAGNIQGFRESVKEPLEKHCTKPFRFLNVNWKGDVMLCCNDYYGKTKMGNVAEEGLEAIWNSEKFNKYRLRLQNKNRNQFLCSQCDSNGGFYPHMVTKVTFGADEDKKILGGGYKEL